MFFLTGNQRSLSAATKNNINISDFEKHFLQPAFAFVADERNIQAKDCKLLIVCFAHGSIHLMPRWIIFAYKMIR